MNSVAAELAKRWNIELPSQSAANFNMDIYIHWR